MATIKENYCSKEIYRLLIKRGFDGEIHTTFDEEGYTQPSITHQTAMKWLREVYHIHIELSPYFKEEGTEEWCARIYSKGEWVAFIDKYNKYDGVANTYEECTEKAIRYCLEKLI